MFKTGVRNTSLKTKPFSVVYLELGDSWKVHGLTPPESEIHFWKLTLFLSFTLRQALRFEEKYVVWLRNPKYVSKNWPFLCRLTYRKLGDLRKRILAENCARPQKPKVWQCYHHFIDAKWHCRHELNRNSMVVRRSQKETSGHKNKRHWVMMSSQRRQSGVKKCVAVHHKAQAVGSASWETCT